MSKLVLSTSRRTLCSRNKMSASTLCALIRLTKTTITKQKAGKKIGNEKEFNFELVRIKRIYFFDTLQECNNSKKKMIKKIVWERANTINEENRNNFHSKSNFIINFSSNILLTLSKTCKYFIRKQTHNIDSYPFVKFPLPSFAFRVPLAHTVAHILYACDISRLSCSLLQEFVPIHRVHCFLVTRRISNRLIAFCFASRHIDSKQTICVFSFKMTENFPFALMSNRRRNSDSRQCVVVIIVHATHKIVNANWSWCFDDSINPRNVSEAKKTPNACRFD